MTIQRSQPLPECVVCERPTRRETHERNGGYCSRCKSLRPAYVPTPAQLDAGEWQTLAAQRGRAQRDELAERRRRRRHR